VGKIIVILAICAAGGYAYKNGYFAKWIGQAQEGAGMDLEQGAKQLAEPPMSERMRRQQEEAEAHMRRLQQTGLPASAPNRSQECAQARQNVQQIESWMRRGGTVVETDPGSLSRRKLSENQTFDELSRHRLFIEQNCR
jgi:hypothetical protein